MDSLNVEIWSDIACPFCFVGKRHFESALAMFEHREHVTVTWRSFELDPAAPPAHEGDVWDNISRSYRVSRDEAIAINKRTQRSIAAAGIEAHFERVRPGNMFDGHRLIHLARARGKQGEMKERLLSAYFTEGKLIADHGVLRQLGSDVGLPEVEVDEMLASRTFADEVREDEATARTLGITGVPFFVVDRRFDVSGAQPPATLLSMLQAGWSARGRTGMS